MVKNVLTTNEFKFLLDVNAFTYADGQKNEFIEENYGRSFNFFIVRLMAKKHMLKTSVFKAQNIPLNELVGSITAY